MPEKNHKVAFITG